MASTTKYQFCNGTLVCLLLMCTIDYVRSNPVAVAETSTDTTQIVVSATNADDFQLGTIAVELSDSTDVTSDVTIVASPDSGDANDFTITVSGLDPSTEYVVKLTDLKAAGGTADFTPGTTADSPTVCTAIAPIEGLSLDASGTTETMIKVKWDAAPGPERAYDLYLDGEKVTTVAAGDPTEYEYKFEADGTTALMAGTDYTCKITTSVTCDGTAENTEKEIPCKLSSASRNFTLGFFINATMFLMYTKKQLLA